MLFGWEVETLLLNEIWKGGEIEEFINSTLK